MEHYNGQNYMTAILKQCVIYPQKSGRLTINSGKYDVTVVQYERMGGFWGGNRPVERQIKTTSNSASITIDALPQPQPDGFTGAVGQFSIDSRLSGQVFKTNEAASLVYTIKGTGNIKYVKEPVIDFPSEFEQYQPQTDIDSHITGSTVTGTMTVDYTFVPQSVGTFTIGADKFVYFNPDSRQYVTLSTPSYNIKVTQGAAPSAVAGGKQSVSSKNSDILHIKLGDLDLQRTHTYVYNSWWYWPCYLLLLALLVLIVWLYSKQARLNADVQGAVSHVLERLPAAVLRVPTRQCSPMTQIGSMPNCSVPYGAISVINSDCRPHSLHATISQDSLTLTVRPRSLPILLSALSMTARWLAILPARSDEQIEQLYNEASRAMNSMEGIRKK